jgi:proton-dependent oligopeptide transporter, POT family
VKEKLATSKKIQKEHWLDYAEEKYGKKLVEESKMVVKVLKIFMFLPLYSATFSQNSSRFVLQAAKMDGDLGFYTINPDQMVISVTLFILLMVPTFDYIVYPILSKFGIKTPLQKIACGFVTAAASLIIAALIELELQKLPQNSLHILWLLPQFFFIAISDVFVWVSTVNFAYTQAPARMKSVLSSFVFIAFAAGSLINIVISSVNLLESQADEFLLYSVAMTSNLILFILLTKTPKTN